MEDRLLMLESIRADSSPWDRYMAPPVNWDGKIMMSVANVPSGFSELKNGRGEQVISHGLYIDILLA